MASQQEDEAKATPSKADKIRLQMKVVAHYALLGLGPLLATAALVVAVMALMGNRSGHDQLEQNATAIANLTASLATSKAEVDKLKLNALKETSAQNERFKKMDERVNLIIQNVIPLQVKLKMSPTLEQQLSLPASAVAAPVAHPPAPAATHAPAAVQKSVAKAAPPPHVEHAPAKAPAKPSAAPVAKPAKPDGDKELSPQVRAMKEAIERYNKK
jgi:hypothetical protein